MEGKGLPCVHCVWPGCGLVLHLHLRLPVADPGAGGNNKWCVSACYSSISCCFPHALG